jgi:hypothetical protein
MRRPLIVLGCLCGLLGVAAPADAARPQLTSVGQKTRHPSATWTLPPQVDASVIEIATSPETASDGQFFSENVEVFDVLRETDLSWLYEQQLKPGTYYVHVKGFDNSCLSDPALDCGSAWSNIRILKIVNRRPTIRATKWKMIGHGSAGPNYYVTVSVRLTVCDDVASSSGAIFLDERKWLGRMTLARSRSQAGMTLPRPGCKTKATSWRLEDKFFGVGNYTARLWVRDADGGVAKAVTHNWYTAD